MITTCFSLPKPDIQKHPAGRSSTLCAAALIILSTLAAYWNVQYNSLIGYDDIKYLIENEYVRSGLSRTSIRWALTATYDANWFPLTWLSHMLDMTLFGSNPLGHHLENLFLHIANALLLMCILSRMTGHIWRSAVVALLFALHPLHVESVAWAAERKDVLSTLFFLLTIGSYIRYATRRTVFPYAASILLYLCGLASKPMLVSLPLVLLLLDYWPLRRTQLNHPADSNGGRCSFSSLLLEKAPFALLSAASCTITYIVQKNGGTVNDTIDTPLVSNALHAAVNYSTYLRKIFWPVDLGALYPYVHDLSAWITGAAALLLLGLSLTAVLVRQQMPYIITGWLWFIVTMAPVAGFLRIGAHSVADRYTYIPSIGIFLAAVWLLSDTLCGKRHGTGIAALAATAVMIPLAAATWKQTTYWKDSITLFKHTLDVTSSNWVVHNNLGSELLKYNRPQEAIRHIGEALRINPDSHTALFNLGVALNRLGDKPGAIKAFRRVIELNPMYAHAYFEAGKSCYELGDRASALEIHAALTQLDRDLADSLERYFSFLEQIQLTRPPTGR